MKILLSVPGNLRTVPMSKYVVKALRQLGHEVVLFNYQYNNLFERAYKKVSLQKLNIYKNKKLLEVAGQVKPDLFFSIYGVIHEKETIERVKALRIPTACWWLNDPFQLPFGQTSSAPVYDFYFSNSAGAQPIYKENGVNNIHFLPVGIDPDVHRKIGGLEKKYDVVFMGDHHPIRERIINMLIESGIDVTIFGPWRRKLAADSPLVPRLALKTFFTPEQMVTTFNQSKIVLNIHTWMGRWPYGLNPRLFEAAGCGAFQVADFKEEMPMFFENKKDVVWFQDERELPELIRYYLTHDDEREKIALRSNNKAADHTYYNRMKELLSIVGYK